MNVMTLSIADWSSLQDKIDPVSFLSFFLTFAVPLTFPATTQNYGPPLVVKERGFVTEEGCSGLKKSTLQPEDAKAIFYFDRYLAKTGTNDSFSTLVSHVSLLIWFQSSISL